MAKRDFSVVGSLFLDSLLENHLNFEMINRSSLMDTLTGVNNPHFLEQHLGEEIARALFWRKVYRSAEQYRSRAGRGNCTENKTDGKADTNQSGRFCDYFHWHLDL